MAGIIGQINKLVRVVLQIKEQGRQAGKMDILVAFVPDHIDAALIRREAQGAAAIKARKMTEIKGRVGLHPPRV